jgi:uncharacterized protein YgiM (DUF1202 family)
MKRFAILCLLLPGLLKAEAVKRYITLDGTRLLSKPMAFSKSLGTLKKGTMVMAEPARNGYYKVQVGGGDDALVGYLSGRAMQENRPKIGATSSKSSDASAEEVAAATKGFNKQVEAEYKKGNAKLDYEGLDKLMDRTAVQDPKESLEGFREKGKLGEFSEAANGK